MRSSALPLPTAMRRAKAQALETLSEHAKENNPCD